MGNPVVIGAVHRRIGRLYGTMLGLGLTVGMLAGCAQQVGDIDRTQPNRVKKTLFEGEWYLSRTVIDVPYTTEFTFIGEAAELERIRWEIQRDVLVAYRVYDRVENTDRAVRYSETPYQGAPIAAFPIESHFDIVREYNAQTGEQSNVLVENTTDRAWYDRDYIRVNWSQNVLPSLTFLVDWSGPPYPVTAPVSWHPEAPDDPNKLRVGLRQEDGGWQDILDDGAIGALGSADYLETTVHLAVEPAHMNIEDWFGSVWRDPTCWYYSSADCEHQNVSVRMSFLKVPESSSYEPLVYPDNAVARDTDGSPIRVAWGEDGSLERNADGWTVHHPWFDKFGFFRIERYGYDQVYGEVESARTYLATRFNLWNADGTPKPIVYYLSVDFPSHLKNAAQEMADQWNDVFREAVAATGVEPPERMFELRENTGQRIGDMRWSFLYWVPKPTKVGLLGYGPSNADPITGEIVNASAYVYGAPVRELAGMGRQVIALLNGEMTPEEFGLGQDVQALLHQMREQAANKAGTTQSALTMEALEEFVAEHVDTPRVKALRKLGPEHVRRSSRWFQGRLEKVSGTEMESRLVNDEVQLLKGRKLIGPGDPVPPEAMKHISPVGWLSRQARKTSREHRHTHARRTMYMVDFVDDAIAGLAMELASQNLSDDEILRAIETAVFRSTSEHEVGHTLGLRHNFAGSYDALNFPRQFWNLQGGQAQFPVPPRSDGQISGRMDELRYSSIMEYPARFNADWAGLGHYDRAAILFAYAGQVEVFESAPLDPLITDVGLSTADVLQEHRHYTSLPSVLGGVDAMFQRRFVPYGELQAQLQGDAPWTLYEVPYRFCSDEYEGATYWCAMYDAGMDPYEIVADAASRYEQYYFFDAYKRDRAGWDGWWYDGLLWDRYFRHMLNQYQHWAYFSYDRTFEWDTWREEGPELYGIEDTTWELARDGGAPLTAATRESLRFLIGVLATPNPGAYVYDSTDDMYRLYSEELWPLCTPGQREKDDPTLPCVDLNVDLGVGRHAFTTYDPAGGYYFYERPLWVGAFTDKILALEALADPTVTFLGVETSEDVQSYALGFFLYFPEILSKVSGGIIADDTKQFAGTMELGTYYKPDPFAGSAAGRTAVDPDTWSTVQYYAMWLAMSGYAAGFDNTFNDLMRVWYDGSGLGQTLPDVDDPSVATWFDPTTQRTWRAVKHPDDELYSVGWEMITRAAALQVRADDPSDPDDAAYAKALLGYQRELIDLSMGMWELYGTLTF